MPAILGLLPSALNAVSGGMSASAWIKEMQAIGMGARRSEMFELYKIAGAIIAKAPDEVFRDITQVPTASEIQVWPTKRAEGFAQTVTLIYRDRTTGKLNQTYWKTSNPQPLKRETAMATAVSAYADSADRYNQDLIGALHTSTYEQIPFQAAA